MNFRTFYIDNSRIQYQEMLPEDPLFEKFYLIQNPGREGIVAIPDGCIDIQFTWNEGLCRGFVCGSFLRGKLTPTGTYSMCFGLKLHPGVLFACMDKRVIDFVDQRIQLDEFLEVEKLEKELEPLTAFPDMIDTALRFFRQQRVSRSNNIASSTTALIRSSPGARRVGEMIRDLGYSHRYVDSVFKSQMGITVKKYADIIRAQAAIDYLDAFYSTDVFLDLGYYDQAHFIHEFKRYTLLTPRSFVKQRKLGGPFIIV